MRKFNRLFGVGLNKTGTTSLAAALELLGIPTLHHTARVKASLEKERKAGLEPLSTEPDFRAFADYPIDEFYQELDATYPNSIFISTNRDLESWLDSRERHVMRNQKDPNYKGNWTVVDRDAWEERWYRHLSEVSEYFEDRPDDLLCYDMFSEVGWEPICAFLEVPVPNVAFPRENFGRSNAWKRSRVGRMLRAFKVRLTQMTRILL